MPPKNQRRRKTGGGKKQGAKNGADSDSDAPAGFDPPARGPPDEMSKMAAQKFKDEGNVAFTAGKWLDALGQFTRAIEMDPTDHVFYSNRSAANLKLMRTRDAVADATQCVAIKPDWAKGYSRLGSALLADMQPADAKAAFEKGLKIDPKGEVLLQGLKDAGVAVEEEKKRLAEEEKEKEAEEVPKYASPEDSVVIGIDLGTTFSCVAVWRNNTVEILEDEGGNRTTPSFVAFTEDGARLVGEAAKSQAARNPKNTLYDVKRILGQKMFEPSVKDEVKRFPFEVKADPETEDPRIKVEALQGKLMPPEQVSGLVLAHMKRIAEARLGHPVKKAVVTVPAYFNDAQRTATKSAGTIAGLDVLRIINEPTAAALAYGLDKKEGAGEESTEGTNVLIYDLGGGTFDVSVLRIEDGMFQVLATGGDTHLGGEDFDSSVVDHFVSVLKGKGTDLKSDDKLMRKLRSAVEKAKRTLSSGTSTQVEFEDHSLELSREKFEALNKATFDRTFDTVKKVLKDAKLENKDIDDVVLIGGSTRIPKIQEALSAAFGGKQLCRSINPDEAVAYGAAVQGAILSGVRNAACDALVLLDVTPRSLGIEIQGKRFSVIIPRNSSIPCKKSDTYTTTEDYQTSIEVCVYEGERPNTDGNRLLGEFSVTNIERAKQGEPQLEVTFALDANGILDVSAVDKKTRARAECRIQGACKALDAATLAKMAGEAEEFAAEDAEYREQADMRQELQDLAYDLQESSDPKVKQKAEDCLDFIDSLGSLGKPPVRRSLEKWLKELRD